MAAGRVQVFRELTDPDPSLQRWLDDREQAFWVDDEKGVTHLFIENHIPRPSEVTEMIVGRAASKDPNTGHKVAAITGCTKGFALFVDEGGGAYDGPIAYYSIEERAESAAGEAQSSLQMAEDAAGRAKVVVTASVDGVDRTGWGSLTGGDPAEDDGTADSKR